MDLGYDTAYNFNGNRIDGYLKPRRRFTHSRPHKENVKSELKFMDNDKDPFLSWKIFTEAMGQAGSRMDEATQNLSPEERADGFRALLRALHNQLARFEVDRTKPEFVPFNTWRQKFFMDTPDFLYWVADIDSDRRYQITGNRGSSVFMSITAYAGAGLQASSVARITSDEMRFDAAGQFEVLLGGRRPLDPDKTWLAIPEGANVVWVRQFYDDMYDDIHGDCTIKSPDPIPIPGFISPESFSRKLQKLGPLFEIIAKTLAFGQTAEINQGNHIREWSQMQGGAVYTEPGIYYQRGAWKLEPGQALVLEATAVNARYFNIQLYSRYLNSLDHRHRCVSLTGKRIKMEQDHTFRLVLSAENPGVSNWLDTEGRPFGMFIIRWLQPEETPPLPKVRVMEVNTLKGGK
jgi:hypothetical protein